MASSVLRFAKYQGLGNDFLVVDLREHTVEPSPEREGPEGFDIARQLCDRRFGVGGDGVLSLTAPSTEGAAATMRVLNADGSEAEMCGNGIRCVVKFLLEAQADARSSSITIDTGAGPLTCSATWTGDHISSVTVDMGRPRTQRGEIPMTGPAEERCLQAALPVGEIELPITAVSMGNPHAIAFVSETGTALRSLAESVGPGIERHESFPNRTNAEFARVHSPTDIELVVWERGCGITLACGTGACATAVAACLAGHCKPGDEITVRLLGGPLAITVAPDYSTVHMSGPAEHVFDGSVDLAPLA